MRNIHDDGPQDNMGDHPLRYDTTTTSPILSKTLVQPEISVDSGITEIDILLKGFKAGTITYIDGDSSLIADLPNRLCVSTYQQFHAHTLYLDGGLCADPYEIARYARALELDQYEVLHHVYVSRAFTVYQLSTLNTKALRRTCVMFRNTLLPGFLMNLTSSMTSFFRCPRLCVSLGKIEAG